MADCQPLIVVSLRLKTTVRQADFYLCKINKMMKKLKNSQAPLMNSVGFAGWKGRRRRRSLGSKQILSVQLLSCSSLKKQRRTKKEKGKLKDQPRKIAFM